MELCNIGTIYYIFNLLDLCVLKTSFKMYHDVIYYNFFLICLFFILSLTFSTYII